jgi:hypothetical protein
MQTVPCHHLADSEIPEKHWAYRFAKKYWFFGSALRLTGDWQKRKIRKRRKVRNKKHGNFEH